jgi:hypothetical protein
MKKLRFTFILPILWIVFATFAIFSGKLSGVLFVLLVPSIVIVGAVQRSLFDPSDIAHRDTTYFVAAFSIFLACLVGFTIDILVSMFRNKNLLG